MDQSNIYDSTDLQVATDKPEKSIGLFFFIVEIFVVDDVPVKLCVHVYIHACNF